MQRILICRGKTMIYINTTALLFAAYMFLQGQLELLLISYLSICMHEGAHACVARLLGYRPTEIEFSPMGAIMRMPTEDARKDHIVLVLLAGPVMTAILCGLTVRFSLVYSGMMSIFRNAFLSNLLILMLNLLPCYPLDGGGILALLLSCVMARNKVDRILRICGYFIGGIFIAFCFVLAADGKGLNLSMVMTGCLLVYAAQSSTTSEALRMMRQLMNRKTEMEQRGIMKCRIYAVLESMTVLEAVRLLPPNALSAYYVIESGTMKCKAVLTEDEVIYAAINQPSATFHDLQGRQAANAVVYS